MSFQRFRPKALFLALVILVPVFWQSRIQSADLASHIYNAWLALQLERGHVSGLYVASQTTNILFDLILLNLLKVLDPDWTQRIAVSLCVLTFAGGAWAAVRSISGRFPTYFFPLMAILAYGFVFRLGLFNFYLGMGFAFAALALLWQPPNRLWWWTLPLCILCYTSHALAFVWLISITAYVHSARRVRPRRRIWLVAAAGSAIIGFALFVLYGLPSQWEAGQPLMTTGADQAFIYGSRYKALVFGWILLQVSLLVGYVDRSGLARLLWSVPFQICLLHAVTFAIVPSLIWLPGYAGPFNLFAERMGLAQGVMALALLAKAPAHWLERAAAAALAVIFFAWSYQDSARLNRLEDTVERALAGIPQGSRIVSGLCDRGRSNYAYHLVDRACTGRCYSFGNYEPSTTQFRLRAHPKNDVVSASRVETNDMEFGGYEVSKEAGPLFLVQNSLREVSVRALLVGEKTVRPCPSDGDFIARLGRTR